MSPKTILIKLGIEIAISLAAAFVTKAIDDRIKTKQLRTSLLRELGLEKSYFELD